MSFTTDLFQWKNPIIRGSLAFLTFFFFTHVAFANKFLNYKAAFALVKTLPPHLIGLPGHTDTVIRELTQGKLSATTIRRSLRPKPDQFDRDLQSETYAYVRHMLQGLPLSSICTLDLSYLGLREFPVVFLKKFPELVSLNLTGNSIERLPDDLMRCAHLADIKLSSVGLIYVSPEMLSFLINHAAIVDDTDYDRLSRPHRLDLFLAGAPGEVRAELMNHLRYQRLQPAGGFYSNDAKKFIRANLARLGDFLYDVEVVDLKGCSLKTIPSSFGKLLCLKRLDLSDNQLRWLPFEIKKLKQLKRLDLSNNNFKFVPDVITRIKSLTELNLAGNPYSTLPHNMGDLINIQKLDCTRSNLNSLPLSLRRWLESDQDRRVKLVPGDLINLPSELNLLAKNWGFSRKKIAELNKNFLLHDFLKDAPKTLKEQEKRIFDGTLEPLPDVKSWTRKEINFLNKSFKKIAKLHWVFRLSLKGLELRKFPLALCVMTGLEELVLSDNQLSDLPQSFGNFIHLDLCDLTKNRFAHVPHAVQLLPNLRKLSMNDNFLYEFECAYPAAFPRLQLLFLCRNFLSVVPPKLYEFDLVKLDLSDNMISVFSAPQGRWPNLGGLYLSRNQLTEFPAGFGARRKIRQIILAHNYITHVPLELQPRLNKVNLVMSHNPLIETQDELGFGAQHVRNFLPMECHMRYLLRDGLDIEGVDSEDETDEEGSEIDGEGHDDDNDDNAAVEAVGEVAHHEFTHPHHACENGPYLNDTETQQLINTRYPCVFKPEILRTIRHPKIPLQDVRAENVLGHWHNVLAHLSLDDASDENYQDFELYRSYIRADEIDPQTTNRANFQVNLLPRLTGFIKSLFRVPLDEEKGEKAGWQVHSAQQNDMQQIVAFVLREMKETQNISLFMQFVPAILECSTGQKTAFEVMILNRTKGPTEQLENIENLDTRIKLLFAAFKEMAFRNAMNQSASNLQSVHLLEHYLQRLGPKLGIVSHLSHYRDLITHDRVTDMFHGNLNKALEAFYAECSVRRFVQFLVQFSETAEDRELKKKLRKSQDDYARIKEISQQRPITSAMIQAYCQDQDLVPVEAYDHKQRTHDFVPMWAQFFDENPWFNNLASLTYEGVIRILNHMGMIESHIAGLEKIILDGGDVAM